MKISGILLGLAIASSLAIGCASQTDAEDNSEAAESDLSAAGKALIGSYIDDSGAFRSLVLTSTKVGARNTFFADVDTGIRCIMAPCPSSARIEGTFTAGSKTITLRSDSAPAEAQHLLGRYSYLVQGEKFSLWRKDFAQSLEKVGSYCAPATAAQDCDAQNLIVPSCMGSFSCASNSCNWKCGVGPWTPCSTLDEATCKTDTRCQAKYGPSWCSADGLLCSKDFAFKGCGDAPASSGIWPANATKLVASSPGGGFVAPAPPGSTCAIGHQKYSLDVATKTLSWETCAWQGSGTPLKLATGTRVVTAAESATVSAAMGNVKVATRNACGADKPFLSLEVTSPVGVKKYADSFYACNGGPQVYVDQIDGVFEAFRLLAH